MIFFISFSCAPYDSDARCRTVAKMLAEAFPDFTCRIYLCGRVTIERRERILRDSAIAGPQGRLLLAFLGTRRNHPVSKTQLIDAVWGVRTPPSADTAINALISKVRSALRSVGISPPYGVETEVGTYQFQMPAAWIDLEQARIAIDRAEGALRRHAFREAWSDANVAATIARNSFLPDEQQPWVVQERTTVLRVLRRSLLVLSTVSATNEEYELGIQHASEALAVEPFDELACQALMRAHAAAGNRAEALRVYATCRKLFRDELGANPSKQTEAVFLDILKADR